MKDELQEQIDILQKQYEDSPFDDFKIIYTSYGILSI